MSETDALVITESERLPGIAETLEDLAQESDARVAEALAERLSSQRVAVPGDRSEGGLLAYLMGLLQRLRGRRFVRDLGVEAARVPVMAFHAPPGGSAHLKLTRSADGGGGISLDMMGLGFGSGMKLKTEHQRDFHERTTCFRLESPVTCRLREYADADGRPSVQVDVLTVGDPAPVAMEPCPRCFAAPAPGPMPRLPERVCDLSADSHGMIETWTHDLSRSTEFELALDLPVLAGTGLTAGVAVNRTVRSLCVAEYTLPGGARFTAYRTPLAAYEMPFWGRD